MRKCVFLNGSVLLGSSSLFFVTINPAQKARCCFKTPMTFLQLKRLKVEINRKFYMLFLKVHDEIRLMFLHK